MRIIGAVSAVFCVFVLIFFVFVLLSPRYLGWEFDNVLTGSMEPTLPVGSMIAVAPVKAEDIKTGDIILYRPPVEQNMLITHRVVEVFTEKGKLQFRTKGDANEDPDTYILDPSSIRGRVVFKIPCMGYLASFVKSRFGFVLLVVAPAVVIIGGEIRNILVSLKQEEERARDV